MKCADQEHGNLTGELERIRQQLARLATLEVEREEAEKRIKHLNAVLSAIRNVNQLITREKDRNRLLQGACDALIETRGYGSAWIVILDKSRALVASAEAGLRDTFSALTEQFGRGDMPDCARRALAQPGVVVTENPSSDCGGCPLAGGYGELGAMTVQLEYGGKVYGLLAVSAPDELVSDEEEQALFEEVARDISFALYSIELEDRRRQAEEAQRESEQKYRTLMDDVLDTSAVGVFILDSNFQVVWVNQAIERYFGVHRDEVVGKDKRKLIQERIMNIFDDPETFSRKVLATYDNNTYIENFECHVLADGEREERWLEHWSQPVKSGLYAGGRIEHYSDITEWKRAEEALRESEERYRVLFEGAAEGILVADIESREFKYANPAICRMLGYSKEELEGMRVDDIHPKEALRHVISEFEAQARGEKTLAPSIPCLRKDGTTTFADIKTTTVVFGGRKYNVGFFTDITEPRRLEEQLRQSQKLEAVGRLAGGIAHDFNNLLTAILGYSETLLSDMEPDDPMWEPLEQINEAGHRASALTRQLLAFSRKQIMRPEVLDMNKIVAGMDRMLRRIIGEDIDLTAVLSPKLGLVEADPSQIEQVIVNLAVNARAAMPTGGKLTIETGNVYLGKDYAEEHAGCKPGHYVMLAVSDTGCGMDTETQKHIFEPFFTTRKKGEGTGLGLSTVYGIVKQSGGNIWVYSEPGVGTTFKVYFPRVEEKKTESAKPDVLADKTLAPTKPAAGTAVRKCVEELAEEPKTVLVVDDEEAVRKLACRILEKCRFTLLEADRGQKAMSICEEHEGAIDLVITDVVMPDMTGRELAHRLAAVRPATKFLFMSGYAIGAVGVLEPDMPFLQKPFTQDALMRAVRDVLAGGGKAKGQRRSVNFSAQAGV